MLNRVGCLVSSYYCCYCHHPLEHSSTQNIPSLQYWCVFLRVELCLRLPVERERFSDENSGSPPNPAHIFSMNFDLNIVRLDPPVPEKYYSFFQFEWFLI